MHDASTTSVQRHGIFVHTLVVTHSLVNRRHHLCGKGRRRCEPHAQHDIEGDGINSASLKLLPEVPPLRTRVGVVRLISVRIVVGLFGCLADPHPHLTLTLPMPMLNLATASYNTIITQCNLYCR